MTARSPHFVEDLSALARRGLLAETEDAELASALERDPTLRLAHQVGLDLDRSTAVRVGDEALIARTADAALGRVAASGLAPGADEPDVVAAPAPRKRGRGIAVLLAAALVCVTGMAAGMWAGVVPARWFASKTASHEMVPVNATARAPSAAVATKVEPAGPSREETSPTAAPPTDSTQTNSDAVTNTEPAVLSKAQRIARNAPDATAQTLFSGANAARRDGDFSRAKRLYSELIGRFPSSDEAELARVSLGKLLLESGDPSAAEREFGQYLKGGRGQLTEEALVSRAESFEKMGRAKAERATWQRLLAEYPASVYAAEAKGRLDALKRQVAPPSP